MIRRSQAEGKTIRCAIYTRVSTPGQAEGEFSSIDNQREAAEAYVASQAGQGWQALKTRYDDAGFTGSNTDRPALQHLLGDIEAGQVDLVVIYKIDRLSRSLLDFARLIETLDRRGVGLVSVTQQFDTSSSMGKLTLNILLSFAQFEREMISERTRDKMLAARRRGRWTGGPPPLGYDVHPDGGKILVNEDEAERVRAIFQLYLEHGSLTQTVRALAARGWTTKGWTTQQGHYRPGKPFDVATLRRLLTNPVYRGQMRCGGEVHEGEHEAIVQPELFEQVQEVLAGRGSDGGRGSRTGRHGALLRGLLRCASCDAAMSPSTTKKGRRLYRYYVCTHAQRAGWDSCPTKSVPAHDIEQVVIDQIRRIGQDPHLREATVQAAQEELAAQRKQLEAEIRTTQRERDGLAREQRKLATAAGKGGRAAEVARGALEEVHQQLTAVEARLAGLQGQQEALAATAIDPEDLRRTLEEFDPLWEVLQPHERAKVLRLLIERVEYDGTSDQLEITFRPGGVQELASPEAEEVVA